MLAFFPSSNNLSTAFKSQAPAAPGTACRQAKLRPLTRATKMAAQGQQTLDPDRPRCHVMAQRGWINDPNGPIYFNGKYHLFYQHLPTGVEWDWGLVWGHAISTDLVHWEHLPPALRPTPGQLDADGCFSGCCTVDEAGIPTIMYTGVRLRSNQDCGPLPPAECDLQLPFIESQMLAQSDKGDPKLVSWKKQEAPFLALPPAGLPLTGWRDPFVIQRGGKGTDWIILMGAGLKNEGGTTLIYRASELSSTWEYSGLLCLGDPSLGAMWECPLLWNIPEAPATCSGVGGSGPSGSCGLAKLDTAAAKGISPGQLVSDMSGGVWQDVGGATTPPDGDLEEQFRWEAEQGAHVFAHTANVPVQVSQQSPVATASTPLSTPDDPYTHFYCISPDAPSNAVLYWMGSYDPETVTFRLAEAVGPFRLDMGDTVYAPNLQEDAKGRCILWAWVQERRSVGKYDFAGCMASPRVLLRRRGRLIQQPLPELAQLRRGASLAWPRTQLPPNVRMPLEGVSGRCLDVEVVLERQSALISGLTFQSWTSTQGAAAVLYDWNSSQLEVVFEGMDPETKTFSLSASTARRIGGRLEPRGLSTLSLRIILDSSLLEVFAGSGQVITTRVYRGNPPSPQDSGIDLLSIGGITGVARLNAWELSSIWSAPQVTQKSKMGALAAVTGKFEQLTTSSDPTDAPPTTGDAPPTPSAIPQHMHEVAAAARSPRGSSSSIHRSADLPSGDLGGIGAHPPQPPSQSIDAQTVTAI